jgi:hypothetical protein
MTFMNLHHIHWVEHRRNSGEVGRLARRQRVGRLARRRRVGRLSSGYGGNLQDGMNCEIVGLGGEGAPIEFQSEMCTVVYFSSVVTGPISISFFCFFICSIGVVRRSSRCVCVNFFTGTRRTCSLGRTFNLDHRSVWNTIYVTWSLRSV